MRLSPLGIVLCLSVFAVAEADEAQEQAVAALRAFRNVAIKRDQSRPEKPVVEVHFTYASKLTNRNQLVTDATVKDLLALTQLQSLTLEHTQVTEAGLRELATLKHLKSLRVTHTSVSDAGARELSSMSQLEDLALTHLTDTGLASLAALTRLQSLHIPGTAVTDAGLKQLAPFNRLRSLDLGGHAVCAHHGQIVGQERWKQGRTQFRTVRFAADKLTFEFDIDEWRSDAAPIAVEERKVANKAQSESRRSWKATASSPVGTCLRPTAPRSSAASGRPSGPRKRRTSPNRRETPLPERDFYCR